MGTGRTSDPGRPAPSGAAAMIPLIEQKRAETEALCRKYQVRTLEVFGSAARGEFNTQTSDLDFLVVFRDGCAGNHFDPPFARGDLFGRKINLVMTRAIQNPYFLRHIQQDRIPLYAS
jgi:predicted nucleotidyltransferase